MWRCVDLALTDVSEERIASTFRVEESASDYQREQVAADCRYTQKARSIQRHIPEDDILLSSSVAKATNN
jgi:hypothetical protein